MTDFANSSFTTWDANCCQVEKFMVTKWWARNLGLPVTSDLKNRRRRRRWRRRIRKEKNKKNNRTGRNPSLQLFMCFCKSCTRTFMQHNLLAYLEWRAHIPGNELWPLTEILHPERTADILKQFKSSAERESEGWTWGINKMKQKCQFISNGKPVVDDPQMRGGK